MHMMTHKLPELTKATSDIHAESGTQEALATLKSKGFWNSCKRGITDWDALTKAGFDLDFSPDADGKVESVSFRLNEKWLAIMQGNPRPS